MKKLYHPLTLLTISILAIILLGCNPPLPPPPPPPPTLTPTATTYSSAPITQYNAPVEWEYRGASLAGYWHDSYSQPNAYDLVDYMQELGVNYVAVIVSGYQDDMSAIEIKKREDKETATNESLISIIEYIHSKGMSVMLKPHIEPDKNWSNEAGGWRGVIDPDDRAAWFKSYREFIVEYANLAETHQVELFSIGTEMASMTQSLDDQEQWAEMTQAVRKDYHGKVLYSAHEYEVLGGHYEIKDIKSFDFSPLPPEFWSNFDYAGTTVYYDIYDPATTASPNPEVDVLVDGWYQDENRHDYQKHLVDALTKWQNSHGKPVIFSEIGYRSIDYAAYHAYNTTGANGDGLSGNYNEIAQANAYEAALKVWGGVDWLAGAFWWQFIPNSANSRECGLDVNPEIETDFSYTPCGREASNVLHHWYTNNENTPLSPPAYTPELPDLLNLDNKTETILHRGWRSQTSGEVIFNLDTDIHLDNFSSSLHVVSNVPCGKIDPKKRFAQLDYLFSTPQDFSPYSSLVFSILVPPEKQGEVSIVLLNTDGVEWQSTRWIEGGDEWQEFHVALRKGSDELADPWQHPVDFVVPNWLYDEENSPDENTFTLDFNQIAGIRLKALTVGSECAENPELEVWFGDVHLSKNELAFEPAPIELPTLDMFNYDSLADLMLGGNWQTASSGITSIAIANGDVSRKQSALQIMSNLPCVTKGGRYSSVSKRFIEPLDLSQYTSITIQARGDGISEAPYGGEFSIVLVDAAGDVEENWQSTRWLARDGGWVNFVVELKGEGQGNPWGHPSDFIIPDWSQQIENGQLDLEKIVAIQIKSNTTDKDADGNTNCSIYPKMWVWVDNIILK